MTYEIHRYKLRYIMFPILDDETEELIHWDVHRCDCSGRAMKNNWCRCDAEEPDTTFVYTIEEARLVAERIRSRLMKTTTLRLGEVTISDDPYCNGGLAVFTNDGAVCRTCLQKAKTNRYGNTMKHKKPTD